MSQPNDSTPGEATPPPVSTAPLSDARHDSTESVTWPVRVAAAWAWRLAVLGGVTYVVYRFIGTVGLVVFPFIIALFFTAMLHPIEVRMRRLPGRASVAALVALLAGVAVLAGLGYFVYWQISSHNKELGDQVTSTVDHLKHWLETGPLHVKSSDLDKISNNIVNTIKSHSGQLINGAVTTVRTAAEILTGLLLVLLTTFYLLRDGEIVWGWVVRLFPHAARERLDLAGRAGWRAFGGYMRGQFVIALFHGVSITILLFVLRVPLAAALGVLVFIGSFIPLVGLTVTGALAVAIALLEHGPGAAIAVAIAIIVLVQVEGHVLQPVVMSRSVDIHPLAVVLSVIAGTALKGIPGALVAVPLVAFLNTSIKALHAWRPGHQEPAAEPVVAADPP